MPNFDRTGPRGAGPMTGWAMGLCGRRRGAAAAPGFGAGDGWRQGGWGAGRGRGFRRGFGRGTIAYGPADLVPDTAPAADLDDATPEERRTVLKAERNRLKTRLREVEETLTGIGRNLRGEGES